MHDFSYGGDYCCYITSKSLLFSRSNNSMSSFCNFNAGNLKSAMNCSYVKDYEFVTIFDADFQPSSDFLKRTIPHFKAEDGIGLPEEILDHSSFGDCIKLYFMFIRFDILWTLNNFALITLNFLEVVTLTILLVHTFYPLAYEGRDIFWRNLLNRLKIILLVFLVADLVVYVIFLSPAALSMLPFRIAPYIRVVFFILNIRELRDNLFILAGMLGTYLNVLVR